MTASYDIEAPWGTPRLLITKPEITQDVLRTQSYSFRKQRAVNLVFKGLFGDGLFAVEGESHRVSASVIRRRIELT